MFIGGLALAALRSPVPWSPLYLGAAWAELFDASALASFVFNGASALSWIGRINGAASTQTTGSAQPGYSATARNNSPGLTFNGSSQFFSIPNSAIANWPMGSAPATLVTAGYTTVTSQRFAFVYGGTGNGQSRLHGTGFNSPQYCSQFSGSSTWDAPSNVAWAGDRLYISITPGGASPTVRHFVDGVAAGTTAIPTQATTTGTNNIGNGQASGYWSGELHLIGIGAREFTDPERIKLEGWESWTFGKAGANLPATHAHRTVRPYASREEVEAARDTHRAWLCEHPANDDWRSRHGLWVPARRLYYPMRRAA